MPYATTIYTDSSTTCDDTVWQSWVSSTNATTGTYTTSSGSVWNAWNGAVEQPHTENIEFHTPTPEEIANREALLAEQRQRDEEAAREAKLRKERADERAEELLRLFLTDEQREQLERQSSFIVENEERKFRIRRGRSMNVDELDANGNVVAKFCAHPIDLVPNADTMLAQKIMLENDLQGFLQVAHVSLMRN